MSIRHKWQRSQVQSSLEVIFVARIFIFKVSHANHCQICLACKIPLTIQHSVKINNIFPGKMGVLWDDCVMYIAFNRSHHSTYIRIDDLHQLGLLPGKYPGGTPVRLNTHLSYHLSHAIETLRSVPFNQYHLALDLLSTSFHGNKMHPVIFWPFSLPE